MVVITITQRVITLINFSSLWEASSALSLRVAPLIRLTQALSPSVRCGRATVRIGADAGLRAEPGFCLVSSVLVHRPAP
jgi:hypothetical protein